MRYQRDEVVAKIKEKADCREIARQLGIAQGKTGAWHCFNVTCHSNGDRNPSLTVGADGFACKATSCEIKGDVFDLVRKKEGATFPEAKARLAAMLGIEAGAKVTPIRQAPAARAAAINPQPSPMRQPSPEAQKLMADLWAIVQPLRPTQTMVDWLESRGLDDVVPGAVGVRDFAPALPEIRSLLRGQPTGLLQEVGLMTDSEYPWTPLFEVMEGNQAYAGACFPVYHPAHPDFPMEWRWRYYAKPQDHLKVHALCGSNRLHVMGLNRPFKASRILVCEGEMDYLTLYQSQAAGVPAFDVIGLCAASSKWRDEYSKLIEDAALVVFVGHRPEKSKRSKADEIETSLERLWGAAKADMACLRYEVSEGDDLNDKLKSGTFAAWLKALTDLPQWSDAGIAESGARARTNEHNTAALAAGMGV